MNEASPMTTAVESWLRSIDSRIAAKRKAIRERAEWLQRDLGGLIASLEKGHAIYSSAVSGFDQMREWITQLDVLVEQRQILAALVEADAAS